MSIPYLRHDAPFPDPQGATPEGIVAIGGDLNPQRLLEAYYKGIFPWYSEHDPILWWSPDPRCVLFVDDFRINRTLSKRIRNGGFEVRFDSDFSTVIRSCRKVDNRDKEGTWILPEMIAAYDTLHELGYAHSIEAYLDGNLVGGLYGVSVGKAFFGESMFSLVKDASKIALAALVQFCKDSGIQMIDSQIPTDHMIAMGAVNIPRSQYLKHLSSAVVNQDSIVGSWAPYSPHKELCTTIL